MAPWELKIVPDYIHASPVAATLRKLGYKGTIKIETITLSLWERVA
jgi:hypothetical protein